MIHSNESSSYTTQSTIRGGSIDEVNQDRASLGCNDFYSKIIYSK